MLEQLRRAGPVDHVVAARSWKYSRYLVDGDKLLPRAAAAAAWQRGADSVLDALTAVSGDVVLLADGPRAPSDVPVCLSEHLQEPTACAFARAGHTELDAVLTAAERRAAKGRVGVRFVDPTDLICPDPLTCPVVTSEGTVVYRDDSHMTATYSASMKAPLEKLLALRPTS